MIKKLKTDNKQNGKVLDEKLINIKRKSNTVYKKIEL